MTSIHIYARAYKTTLVIVINNGLIIGSGTSFLVNKTPWTGLDYVFYTTI